MDATVVAGIEAVLLSGSTLTVFPLSRSWPTPKELAGLARRSGASIVLTHDYHADAARADVGGSQVCAIGDLLEAAACRAPDALDPPARAGNPVILQFTSGSTGDGQGVMVSEANLISNVGSIQERLSIDPTHDVLVSWLPLFHDMGLLGFCLFSMLVGTPLVLGRPESFLSRPTAWLEWISAYGGTLSGAPNFAYAVAARAAATASGLELGRWRLALNGGEPIDLESVRRFCEVFRGAGFDPSACAAATAWRSRRSRSRFPRRARA